MCWLGLSWPGGGDITVDLDRRPASLRLTVDDDGVGISDDWSIDRDANLGLRIAATLVESELGGTLDVRSKAPQTGTRCELVLPLPR